MFNRFEDLYLRPSTINHKPQTLNHKHVGRCSQRGGGRHGGPGNPPPAAEKIWHTYASQGQILAWAFRDLSERGAARAKDAQGTPTQSHVSPSILVNVDRLFEGVPFSLSNCVARADRRGHVTHAI